MKLSFITLFPELVRSYFEYGLVSQSIESHLYQLELINPRDFTQDKHKTVDDSPYGGGDGMLLKYEPLHKALMHTIADQDPKKSKSKDVAVIYLTPQGKAWNDTFAREFATTKKQLVFICGRYAGVDQRFINDHVTHVFSIGDYILNGGELAGLVIAESVMRLNPKFMGNEVSQLNDSFANGLLEGPTFTKPQSINGSEVPAVFLSGNHAVISEVRRALSIVLTAQNRPDLFESWLKANSAESKVSKETLRKAMQTLKQHLNHVDLVSCGIKA